MRRIDGSGPQPCGIMIVGTHPGYLEERTGRVFAGKTGDELDTYLRSVGLSRADVFLTNLYRFYGSSNEYVYTAIDYANGVAALAAEMDATQPALVVSLGAEPARHFFQYDVDLDDIHSIPWQIGDIVVLPLYHPAQAFHSPQVSGKVSYGFQQLGAYLRGEIEARALGIDAIEETDYGETNSSVAREIETAASRIALDTEGTPAQPWLVQYSTHAGRSRAIRATRRDILAAFSDALIQIRPRLTFHNALHDLGMMRALSLPTDLPFDDTMVMAYLLQVEPRGLKALALRHCGMQMSSYWEMVGPASERLAREYLDARWVECEEAWNARRVAAFIEAKSAGRHVKVLPKLPKTPLHKAIERCLRAKDPRKLWQDQWDQWAGTVGNNMLDATLSDVPLGDAIAYGCRDADATLRILPELSKRIDAMGLREVYELELSTYPLIERMQYVGVKPNLDHFADLSLRLAGELGTLQGALSREVGDLAVNANSGDQVAAYLFDTCGLLGDKRTAGGRFATDDRTLEALEHEHGQQFPAIGLIRRYRELFKLKSSFVDKMPALVDCWPYDGRLHCRFKTTSVVTGRLAATMPDESGVKFNILALPKHGAFAKDFRRGFVAEPGHILAEWDLSQIELRMLAHLSQDPVMLRIFREGKTDLHAATAERIFGVPPAQQDKSKHRLPAKAINFGIPMGMTAVGLSAELRKNGVMIDEDDAQRWLDDTLNLYRNVRDYQAACAAEVRRVGYVRCLSGRIRYIGGIRSRDERVAAEAARFAFSTPIQEGATLIMKRAEATLWQKLQEYWAAKRWVEPLLQCHDALTLELEDDPDLAQNVHRMMQRVMTKEAVPEWFSVPVETSGEWGYNWADMKGFVNA